MTWFAAAVVVGLALIALAAVLPIHASAFTSHGVPARDYADAIARCTRQQDADDRVVAPGARTVLMTHGALSWPR